MTTVGLTGATGHLGGLLLARLLDDPAVASVTSVARREVPVVHPRLRHVRADLRSGDARRALAGVDLCYHLGFQLWDAGGREAMADANLAGTANVLAARPAVVVFASSAAVYGAWPDNPLPIDESHPPRPNVECPYAVHKLEAERRCAEAAATVVVRLGAVLGPHADAAVAGSVAGYRLAVPAVRGVRQAVQFLHEEDAVAALLAAGAALADPAARTSLPMAGRALVCNAATSDWLDAEGIAAVAGGRVVALPRPVLLRLSEAAHRARLLPFGADRSSLLGGPLALRSDLAADALGWVPTRSSAEVLAGALAAGSGLGPLGRRAPLGRPRPAGRGRQAGRW